MASVGTASLTDYLDLGANVILLWYGGKMVRQGAHCTQTWSLVLSSTHGCPLRLAVLVSTHATLRRV